MQSTLGAAWSVSKQRFVGTALGAAMGALLTAYAQNVSTFGVGVFVLGLICALLRIGRNAFRYAGITLAIVMLVARAEPAWMIAIHRFLEISVGIAVGLLLTAVWRPPEALGSELSGVIEKLGPNTDGFDVGTEVFGATNALFVNGYAKYTIATA